MKSKDQMNPTSPSLLAIGVTPCLQRTLRFACLAKGEVNRACSQVETASGKATNVARVATALGSPASLLTFVGGPTGDSFASLLRASVPASRFQLVATEVEAPMRICQTLIDEASKDVTELVEEAENPTEAEWFAFSSALKSALATCQIAVIAGSPPPRASADIYLRFAGLANESGRSLIIDSQGRPLRNALSARPLLVKCNREELSRTTERSIEKEADAVVAAQFLMRDGATNALITNGPASALLMTPDGSWRLHPPSIQAINPIGSGDALTAGLAHRLLRGDTLLDAAAHGVACGTANALTETSGEARPRDVDTLLQQVGIEAI